MSNTLVTLPRLLFLLAFGFVVYKTFRLGGRSKPALRINSYFLDNDFTPSMVLGLQGVAMHETGHFTSRVYRENNNPWGMKQPKNRETTSTGPDKKGFAQYRNFDDALQDMILYLNDFGYPRDLTPFQLVKMMQENGYFTDSFTNYWEGVKAGIEKLGGTP